MPDRETAGRLEREIQWFNDHREDLVTAYYGKYLVIKDGVVQGSYDTAQSAYESGVKAFGIDGFLLKQALPHDPFETIPALWAGAMRAAV